MREKDRHHVCCESDREKACEHSTAGSARLLTVESVMEHLVLAQITELCFHDSTSKTQAMCMIRISKQEKLQSYLLH